MTKAGIMASSRNQSLVKALILGNGRSQKFFWGGFPNFCMRKIQVCTSISQNIVQVTLIELIKPLKQNSRKISLYQKILKLIT